MFQIINTIFRLYELIVLARVLLSWIPVDRTHPIIDWIHRLTEPLLAPIREILPTEKLGIDLSPLVLLIALSIIQRILLSLLIPYY